MASKKLGLPLNLIAREQEGPSGSQRDIGEGTCPVSHNNSSNRVFISYSSKDKLWADAACSELESSGIACWIAPRDIAPGTEWGASIIAGIDACRIMVLIFSENANSSPQVRREVERALSKGLLLLPCRIEDFPPFGALEYALCNTHWLDLFAPLTKEHLMRLSATIRTVLDCENSPVAVPEAVTRPVVTVLPADHRIVSGTKILCVCSQRYLTGLLGSISAYQAMKQQMDNICNVFSADGSFTEAPGVDSLQFADVLSRGEFDIIQAGLYIHPMSGRIYFSGFDESASLLAEEKEDSLTPEAFARLVERTKAKLVLLVACDSLALASRLSRFTNVVASSRLVGIPAVIAWEQAFYQSLGRGEKLSTAVDTANTLKEQSMMLLLREDLRFEPKSSGRQTRSTG